MYATKIPKSQQPSKSLYTLYYPHTVDIHQREWKEDYIQFISIDPAIKNLAIRVERRYFDNRVVCLYTDKFSPFEIKMIDNVEINKIYENINKVFNTLVDFFKNTHYVLIEKQLPTNYQATRVAQHILSYFIMQLQDKYVLASIIEVDSKLKGKMLGVPKHFNKNDLKKWAVEKALELCKQRDDQLTLDVLLKIKKKDDIADVLCQIEGFCVYINSTLYNKID